MRVQVREAFQPVLNLELGFSGSHNHLFVTVKNSCGLSFVAAKRFVAATCRTVHGADRFVVDRTTVTVEPDAAAAAAIAGAAEEAAKPIDDIRGSAAYKKLLLGRLVRAHFMATAAAGEAV